MYTHDQADARTQDLHNVLVATEDLADFLQSLVGLAADAIGADVSCGVTVIRNGEATTVVSSDRRASAVDEVQYRLDYGPCLHSARTNTTVFIDDFETDGAWTRFREDAMKAGVRSSLSNPLRAIPHGTGAVNLYSAKAGLFDPDRRDLARRYAAEADRALAVALRMTGQDRVNRQLRQALETRPVIDHAVGVLMERNRCSSRDAFAMLTKQSQNTNTKLRDIAAVIVNEVGGELNIA